MAMPVRSTTDYVRKFDLIIHSTTDLQDVRKLGKMKVYARVSISEAPELDTETLVDKVGETSPHWNCHIKYMLAEEIIHQQSTNVGIKLYCKRSLLADKYVGEVNINLRSLFERSRLGKNLCYDVVRDDSEGTFGRLKLSYRFGEEENIDKVIAEEPSKVGKILKGAAGILLQVVLGAAVGVSIEASF